MTSVKIQPKNETPQTLTETNQGKDKKPWVTPRNIPTIREYCISTDSLVKEVGTLLTKVEREFNYEKSVSISQPKYTLEMKKRALENCGESVKQSIEKHCEKYMKCIAVANKLKLYFEELTYGIEQKENRAYKSIYDIETFYMKDLSQYVFKVLQQEDKKPEESNLEKKDENKIGHKDEVDLDILVCHKDSEQKFIESLKTPLECLRNLAVEKDVLEPNLAIFKKNNDVDGAALFFDAKKKDVDSKIEAGKQAVKYIQDLVNSLDKLIPTALSESKPRYVLEKTQLGVIKEWIETRETEVNSCIKDFEKYVKGIDIKAIKEKPSFFPLEDQKILTDLFSKHEKRAIINFDIDEKKESSKINELLPLATKAKELAKMVYEVAKKNGVNSINESVYNALQRNVNILNLKYEDSLKRTNQIRACYEQILSYISLVNEDLKVIKALGEQITTVQCNRKIWAESKTEEFKEVDRKVKPEYGFRGFFGK